MIRRASLLLAAALALSACSGTGASPAGSSGASAAPSGAPSGAPSAAASSAPSAPSGSGAAVTITAVEYKYEGAPATAPTGTSFRLVNGGKELHELVLVRRNADVTTSWEELVAMPQEEAMKFITIVGGLMAAPGATGEGSVTADQPGEYAFLCFIPQGTTALPSAGASLPAGPPHVALGMLQVVTVQ